MTVKEVFSQLKSLSNQTMISHNTKNGATENNQFGVKLGHIRGLPSKIKTNHDLGLELWQTKNIDARLLAILIMKPKILSVKELDDMVKSIDFVQVADWFNAYILKEHSAKDQLRNEWLNSENKWAARVGWNLEKGMPSF